MTGKPAVRTDAAVGEALRAVARDILSEARAVLDDRKKPDAAAVHDYPQGDEALARAAAAHGTASRRRRRSGCGTRRATSHANFRARATRSPPSRHSTISRKPRRILPRRTIASLRGRLDAIRLATEAATLRKAKRAKLAAALERAAAAVNSWALKALSFDDLARDLAKTYQKMRDDAPKDWRAADPEVLHDLRSVVVAHRYQMELIEPLWPKFGELWVAEAQRLRDRLGAFQDLSVLRGLPHRTRRSRAGARGSCR